MENHAMRGLPARRVAWAMLTGAAMLAFVAGCATEQPGHSAAQAVEPEEGPTNRIAVPSAVRDNLGITFAKAEMRHVGQTLRMPGRFEVIPAARREYHAPLAGTVDLLVQQYDEVATGTPLYRLDSAAWRRHKQELAQALSDIRSTSASLMAARVWHDSFHIDAGEDSHGHDHGTTMPMTGRIASLRAALAASSDRLAQLQRLQGVIGKSTYELAESRNAVAQAEAALSQAIVEQANLDATYHSNEAAHDAALTRLRLALTTAAAYTGLSEDELLAPVDGPGGARPYYETVRELEFRASAAGIVETLPQTNGGYVEEGTLVMSTVNPERVRFRAVALQGDLGKIVHGNRAVIMPPAGPKGGAHLPLEGVLRLGLEADPDERTVDVVVVPHGTQPWTRPGVTAYAETVYSSTEDPEAAVPVGAVIQDDLSKVIFRRDPDNPDQVIRLEADLGLSDGTWVVVHSGIMAGDEVVLDGIYELKLTGAGKAATGGHFHADGTFHEGDY